MISVDVLKLIPREQRMCVVILRLVVMAFVASCTINAMRNEVVEAVEIYCAEYSQDDKDVFRQLVNNLVAPNRIDIHCKRDEE